MTAGSLTAAPAPASAATTWLQVSAGYSHTCGVTSTHDLWCWGYNHSGQLGVGDTRSRSAPARVGARGIWASVSTGHHHTCALDLDGTRYCWGSNTYDRLGYGDKATRRLEPSAADSSWTAISVGDDHACGIRDNRRAYCWGSDLYGQLGNGGGRNDGQDSPQRVLFDGRWSAISGQGSALCGLDSEGKRYCWGNNFRGAVLGLDETADYLATPRTWGDGTWRSLDMGTLTGCAISTGRRLYCWGLNSEGQLGVGDKEDHSVPTRVDGRDWEQVTMGQGHTCGLKTNGLGYCWGFNPRGQLGVGTLLISSATTPKAIGDALGDIYPNRPKEEPMTWSALSAGGKHTCGIRTDGLLFCWGDNFHGQLGDGTTTNRTSPREVA